MFDLRKCKQLFWICLLSSSVTLMFREELCGQTATPSPDVANSLGYVQRLRLLPELREALKTLGDRLEKPGQERLVLTGTLSLGIETTPVQLTWEFPGRLRLDKQSGVIAFDGVNASKSSGALDDQDFDLLETLLADSAEHFFIGQMNGLGTRFLGDRFRMDDGQIEDYKGPFYDIYAVTDQIQIGPKSREQNKFYYVNSESLLLEKIRYEVDRGGEVVPVEVQLSDWGSVNGQQVPGLITRLENDAPVMSLKISGAGVGPKADDGIFALPATQ